MRKEIKKLLKQLEHIGWCVEQTKTHYKAKAPQGDLVTISITPSCPFALSNIRADINRVRRKYNEARI